MSNGLLEYMKPDQKIHDEQLLNILDLRIGRACAKSSLILAAFCILNVFLQMFFKIFTTLAFMSLTFTFLAMIMIVTQLILSRFCIGKYMSKYNIPGFSPYLLLQRFHTIDFDMPPHYHYRGDDWDDFVKKIKQDFKDTKYCAYLVTDDRHHSYTMTMCFKDKAEAVRFKLNYIGK